VRSAMYNCTRLLGRIYYIQTPFRLSFNCTVNIKIQHNKLCVYNFLLLARNRKSRVQGFEVNDYNIYRLCTVRAFSIMFNSFFIVLHTFLVYMYSRKGTGYPSWIQFYWVILRTGIHKGLCIHLSRLSVCVYILKTTNKKIRW